MRTVLLAAAWAAGAAGAAPRAAEDWLVMLRWQATTPPTAAADRQWTTAPAEAAPSTDWPALRLRSGATASWRQDRWQADTDSTVGWTPQGPVLYAAERRTPVVEALSLQSLPSRRSSELNLSWSVTWPPAGAAGAHEARGTVTLAPGRWVTVAEWAPPVTPGPSGTGDRTWSTAPVQGAGWRLQARAERP